MAHECRVLAYCQPAANSNRRTTSGELHILQFKKRWLWRCAPCSRREQVEGGVVITFNSSIQSHVTVTRHIHSGAYYA